MLHFSVGYFTSSGINVESQVFTHTKYNMHDVFQEIKTVVRNIMCVVPLNVSSIYREIIT